MEHSDLKAHLNEKKCQKVAVSARRCENYHLLRLFEQRCFQCLHKVGFFQILGHKAKLLTQALDSLLKLIVSHLIIANLDNVKVWLVDKVSKDKLFWE